MKNKVEPIEQLLTALDQQDKNVTQGTYFFSEYLGKILIYNPKASERSLEIVSI